MDRPALDARDARVRQGLEVNCPLQGAWNPDALRRMFDYSVQVRDGRARDTNGLQEAAEETFRCVQATLAESAAPLAEATVFELASAQRWQRHALRYVFGNSLAAVKRRELELVESPLTLCMGARTPRSIQTFSYGELHMPVWGCFAVFADSLRTSGGWMWQSWCPACQQSRTQRGRSVERSHLRFVEQHATALRGR
jgi:hypothetical protein